MWCNQDIEKRNGPRGEPASIHHEGLETTGGIPVIRKESSAHTVHRPDQKDEYCSCYFCLEGWVFVGSVGHDDEECIESIRCRRCDGSGRIKI